jgi:ADP-heptose:LPS heptosyltransferase
MKTRTKVLLDEWFGKGAVLLLNLSARLLGALLSIDHSLERQPKRIAVCKLLGMGSIIQATPMLRALRNTFPSAEIVFVTSRGNRTLLENIQGIDAVYCIDDRNAGSLLISTWKVLTAFWKKKADLYIDLETYSYFSTALATMSCARNRFGFYRAARNIRMGVYTHMMFFNTRAPIAQSYLQMARLAGCRPADDTLSAFSIDGTSRKSVAEKLSGMPGNGENGYVVVNTNASDLRVERRWPADKFVDLLTRLQKQFPEQFFLLIGAPDEVAWVGGIYDSLPSPAREKIINTAGRFTLPELFALIDGSTMVITNDTGPMHIAFALSKPTVALFGPATPAQYGQNPNAFGVYKNIYCSPCVHDFISPPCRGDNQCMKQITVEEVAALCVDILSSAAHEKKVRSHPMRFLKDDDAGTLGIVSRHRP